MSSPIGSKKSGSKIRPNSAVGGEQTPISNRPDAEGNNIAVTVWHFSRWLDFLGTLFQGRPPRDEIWLTQGWAARTGYNPQGKGFQGLGALTGYTLQEVAEVPLLSASELLSYLDQVCAALSHYLCALPSLDVLRQPVAANWPETRLQLLHEIFMGSCGHFGEVEALKAMMRRAEK